MYEDLADKQRAAIEAYGQQPGPQQSPIQRAALDARLRQQDMETAARHPPGTFPGQGGQGQGRGIDWGAIMTRMRQRFGQQHPGMMGQGQGQRPPVGAPPAAPQMDRGRLMGIAQNWGQPQQQQQQQPGGIWRGGQY